MLHDSDIREPLFDFLDSSFGRVRILEEKIIGQSRADIVMIATDALYGIEIKSDADTYARLARQVRDYDKYYDYNIVVVGSRHGHHIREHIPDYWGVITVEEICGKVDFYVLRKPLPNPNVSWEQKLSILWRPELARIQEWHTMPKYKEKSKPFVCRKIAERVPGQIPEEVLRHQVSDLLFERDYTEADELFSEYRKGEILKRLEKESDPAKQIALMTEQVIRRSQLRKRKAGNRAVGRRM